MTCFNYPHEETLAPVFIKQEAGMQWATQYDDDQLLQGDNTNTNTHTHTKLKFGSTRVISQRLGQMFQKGGNQTLACN